MNVIVLQPIQLHDLFQQVNDQLTSKLVDQYLHCFIKKIYPDSAVQELNLMDQGI